MQPPTPWPLSPGAARATPTNATALLDKVSPAVRERVRLVEGTAEDAFRLLGGCRFEVVVCHAVLPYVEDPGTLVAALARLAAPEAIVSLIAKNADALAMRPALEGRWADAAAAFDDDGDVGGMGVRTRAHRRVDLEVLLAAQHVRVTDWHGIRVHTDHLGALPPGEDLDRIVEVEATAGARDPYRALGRLVHLIGRAEPAPPDGSARDR